MAPKFPYPTKVYPPPRHCAYCPSTEGLTNEHIIAYGLGSELIFRDASCAECSKETSKVEDFVLRRYLGPLRSYLSLPSRNPKQRPDGYKLKLTGDGRTWTQKVSLSEHPGIIKFVMFAEPPGRVAGRPVDHPTWSIRLVEAKIFADWERRLSALGAHSAEDKVGLKATDIARMLAKTAHSFAIAELGHDAFEETYVDHLVKREAPDWNYWVGGYHRAKGSKILALHELKFVRRGSDLSIIIHLFVPYCPHDAYEVVVGRLRPNIEIAPGSTIDD
jgi:hypothetical protein